ncbi:MAG: helix-turn-helix domain-containing protein [Treponema sp.]|jgi:transcriptional regulator with XRE-family HTH domain|nr:helix-turn-helix domain-containing protein [Treponema sp.]
MALQEIFIRNMKKYRKNARITHEKLAAFCGSDPCYISHIETGRRFPSITYIEKIAAGLNIAPYLLFYDETDAAARPQARQKLTDTLIARVSETILEVVKDRG